MRLRRKKKDKKKNGEMKTGSLGPKTPPPERKSKFAALGRLFRPWKWKRKKKSEKLEKTANELERKISVRTSREELIRKGVLKEPEEYQNHVEPNLKSVSEEKEGSDSPTENGAVVPSQAGPGTERTELDASGSITTQAQITPTSNHLIVSAANVRPVIICPRPPAQDPPRVPPVPVPPINMDYQEVVPSIARRPEAAESNTHDHDKGDEAAGHRPEDYNNGTDSGGTHQYEAVPASEPDLSSVPKKSALKGFLLAPSLSQEVEDSSSGDHGAKQVGFTAASPAVISSVEPVESPRPTPVMKSALKSRPYVVDRRKLENNKENENSHNGESSSDDEVNYDDDKDPNNLAAKVARQDSLARFLSNRPSRKELVEKNIIPVKSDEEKQVDRESIGTKLTRRLSLRPTQVELEQKNILHSQTLEDHKLALEEKKRYLIRKLSFRPSVEELKERKIIKFNDYIEVTEAHDYDRRADKPWTRLTPKDKAAIRKELNEFKSREMEVHTDSKHLTRFHRP